MRKLLRFVAVCACAAAVLAADLRAGAQELTHVRLAAIPIDVSAEAYYGVEMGFFRKAGLDVEVTSMQSGAAVAPAVSSGAIDIGSSNFVSLAIAHERGFPFVFLAPSGIYSSKAPTLGLVVAKDSPIKTARDLNGKTIAVDSIKNISYITFAAWLDKNGGDISKVKFVELPFPQMVPSVASGRVDAASVSEPFLSQALAGDLRMLAKDGDALGHDFVEGAFFSTAEYAKTHPDVVRKFAAAMAETARWANRNPDTAWKILEKFTKAPMSPGMVHTPFPERFESAYVQPLIDAAAKYGVLKATFPGSDMYAPGLAVGP
jgi:NitT/TauT family transport system substrate-binding protein